MRGEGGAVFPRQGEFAVDRGSARRTPRGGRAHLLAQPVKPVLVCRDDEAMERIEWLRDNLVAGTDWGVCNDPRICVLKTESAGVLYRMRWFDGTQSGFDPQDKLLP